MKTLGVVAFASDIVRAQLWASASVCLFKDSKVLSRSLCVEVKEKQPGLPFVMKSFLSHGRVHKVLLDTTVSSILVRHVLNADWL